MSDLFLRSAPVDRVVRYGSGVRTALGSVMVGRGPQERWCTGHISTSACRVECVAFAVSRPCRLDETPQGQAIATTRHRGSSSRLLRTWVWAWRKSVPACSGVQVATDFQEPPCHTSVGYG